MTDYYANHLSGSHLCQVYALADDQVRRYLDAEHDYCIRKISRDDSVLELGCGYGRVLRELATRASAERWVGIDNAASNLEFAVEYCRDHPEIKLLEMDAGNLTFPDASFDRVLCVQNGLSAFQLDPSSVVAEAMRVLQPRGTMICTTYSEDFWPTRLAWFRRQSEAGLLGPIDEIQTKNGVIACKDGFRSHTLNADAFRAIADAMSLDCRVIELPPGSLAAEFSRRL